MDQNNLNKIFADSPCLSNQVMIDYIDGKLSEKEKNRVEMHLDSCNFCKDEFDGLQELVDKEKLSFIISNLNNQISKKSHGKARKASLFPQVISMAAIILLLVGFAWLFFYIVQLSPLNNNQSAVLQNLEEEKEEEMLKSGLIQAKVDTAYIDRPAYIQKRRESQEAIGVPDISQMENAKILSLSKKIILEEELVEPDNLSDEVALDELSDDKVVIHAVSSEIAKELNADKEENNIVRDVANSGKDSNRKEKIISAKDEAPFEIKTERSKKDNKNLAAVNGKASKEFADLSFKQGMLEYNNQNFDKAIVYFNNSLSGNEKSGEVYYYLGMAYHKLNDPKNSIAYLNKVIAIKSSKYYENALWEKAQILIKTEKKKSAQHTLNEIIKLKGFYAKQAEKQLDSLNRK
jgi:hypothetical protein